MTSTGGREAAHTTTPIMSILGSDGTLRLEVPEGTEGAVHREGLTSDGKAYSKWELVFKSLSGKISNMYFYEGDYGTNLMVSLAYDGGEDTISFGTATPFGEDFMKKIPNINLDEYVNIAPYSFIDDKTGKQRRGVTIKQGDVKLTNYFYDPAKEKTLHGFPKPEGKVDEYTKDDWKIYFMQCRKFLVKYVEDNFIPKFADRKPKLSSENQPAYPEGPEEQPAF